MTAARIKHGTATTAASTETLDADYGRVEVLNRDDTDTLYFRVDGIAPTAAGDDCYAVLPGKWLVVEAPGSGTTAVKLIATGSCAYSVMGLTAFETNRGS